MPCMQACVRSVFVLCRDPSGPGCDSLAEASGDDRPPKIPICLLPRLQGRVIAILQPEDFYGFRQRVGRNLVGGWPNGVAPFPCTMEELASFIFARMSGFGSCSACQAGGRGNRDTGRPTMRPAAWRCRAISCWRSCPPSTCRR